nr:zinc finger, CCHC-type [Tanacetum cinerariifolium]
MVCTRLAIASVDVGMLDKFDRGLQTHVQVFVDFDYAMERSITVMESRYELRLVARIATGCLDECGTWTQVTTLFGVAECCHRVLVGNYYLPFIFIKGDVQFKGLVQNQNQIVSDRFYCALYSKLILPSALNTSKVKISQADENERQQKASQKDDFKD